MACYKVLCFSQTFRIALFVVSCPFLACSLRATFSTEGAQINPLHGSSSKEEAEKDMKFFFPVERTLAVIKPTAMSEKGQIDCM